MSKRNSYSPPDGHDSFLDIVANLVGILIILVVVVGAQAASAWHKNEDNVQDFQKQIAQLRAESKKQSNTASSLELENQELTQKAKSAEVYNGRLREQRDLLLAQSEKAAREIEFLQSFEMEAAEQKRLQAAAEADKVRLQIRNAEMKCNALNAAMVENRETITHYPTPIAKTVFSDEVHYRLLGGKIVHVPMDELVSAMRSEWKVKAEKLKTIQRTTETVGPIGQFRLQYELSVDPKKTKRSAGQVSIQFQRFTVRSIAENIGESIDAALQPNSQFARSLERKKPETTTVSIWVYPDSFEEFEQLKTSLRERGFQTASWPLSEGRQISGGPNGFRTSAN